MTVTLPVGNTPLLIAAAASVVVLLVIYAMRRLRRHDRPDRPLSRVAMLIGLGWSSEAVWELTGRIDGMPTGVRILVFCVLEVMLVISMMRAERHVREHGWPGRAGNTAWTIAAVMAAVGAGVSSSLAEAAIRAAIPLLLTRQWWDGVKPEGAQRPEWVTSWRWTPRRLLLWLGAIEPGDRDVDTVHRERLTQQMVRLEFARRHGSGRWWSPERAARKLARLSLAADDEMVAEVRARVDRADWFNRAPEPEEPRTEEAPEVPEPVSVPAVVAARMKADRVRRMSLRRRVCARHPVVRVRTVQAPREDARTAQEKAFLVQAVKAADPDLTSTGIALITGMPASTVRGYLPRTAKPKPAQKTNGHDVLADASA
jgi:hypothetical protein